MCPPPIVGRTGRAVHTEGLQRRLKGLRIGVNTPRHGGFPRESGPPEAEVKAHLQVDGGPCGHEKQPDQQPPERLDVRLDLRPVVGFGQEGAGKKSAQLQ